jgi:heme-degrading monooxygenase HmoA
MTTIHIRAGEMDAAASLYADSVVPAARQQPGCQGAWLLVDRATGKGVSITLWDSEDNMNAGESSGYYREQVGNFAPMMTAPPVREVYEVAVQG